MKFNIKNTKKAFTLAEVLITLGIIGVVAALTIPTLMQKADERAEIVALKKTFSVLSQAFKLAVNDNGSPENWGLAGWPYPPQTLSLLGQHLKVDKDCTDRSQGCWPAGVTYMYARQIPDAVYDTENYPKLKLVDGTLLIGYIDDPTCNATAVDIHNVCGHYYVDVNGYKKPNQWGKDVFLFYLTKQGIVPEGGARTGWYSFTAQCQNYSSQLGLGCASWAIYNDNMDYLHCNDLDWYSKLKCN